MNWLKIETSSRLFWTIQDIAREMNITQRSARVLASRYAQKNWLTRLKKNLYILPGQLKKCSQEELFYLSNLLQTPSYVSLTTALSFWGVTTQLPQGSIEAIGLKRTTQFEVEEMTFRYQKIKSVLYSGFIRQGLFFIATKEKALLDALYLSTLKKYSLDETALEKDQFSRKELFKLAKQFPKKTQQQIDRLFN